tara:strand:- start:4023 stop:5177 length:1155 start_codon:yes stop_codon:yes gene_type:complete
MASSKKNIKLIHTVPSINNRSAGPSYSILKICENLQFKNYDLKLATLDFKNDYPSFHIGFKKSFGPSVIGNSPNMKKWLMNEAMNNQTLIHTHSLWMMPNIYPSFVKKNIKNTKVIISPRGTLSEWSLKRSSHKKYLFSLFFQNKALRLADIFHATADNEYDDIRRLGFKQPIAIIPNGVELKINNLNNKNKKNIILFLSRIHPKKGIKELLYSWQNVIKSNSNWYLEIVGPDNEGYLEKMKNLSIKLNLKNISFLGPLFDKNKEKKFLESKLFVLPSHSENFGMVIAEALSYGLPVITTKNTPWNILTKKNAGECIDLSINNLTKSILKHINKSDEELKIMGENSIYWMKKDYNWKEVTHKFTLLYDWILDKNLPTPNFIIKN